MKKIIILILALFAQVYCFGQGANNEYNIDLLDVKTVFEEQGIYNIQISI